MAEYALLWSLIGGLEPQVSPDRDLKMKNRLNRHWQNLKSFMVIEILLSGISGSYCMSSGTNINRDFL
jgi:hypothetical protein